MPPQVRALGAVGWERSLAEPTPYQRKLREQNYAPNPPPDIFTTSIGRDAVEESTRARREWPDLLTNRLRADLEIEIQRAGAIASDYTPELAWLKILALVDHAREDGESPRAVTKRRDPYRWFWCRPKGELRIRMGEVARLLRTVELPRRERFPRKTGRDRTVSLDDPRPEEEAPEKTHRAARSRDEDRKSPTPLNTALAFEESGGLVEIARRLLNRSGDVGTRAADAYCLARRIRELARKHVPSRRGRVAAFKSVWGLLRAAFTWLPARTAQRSVATHFGIGWKALRNRLPAAESRVKRATAGIRAQTDQ